MKYKLTGELITLIGRLDSGIELLESELWEFGRTDEFCDTVLKAQSILQAAWDAVYWLEELAYREGY